MSNHADIWICPACGARQDVSKAGFFAEVLCPQCGTRNVVHHLLANFRLDSVLGIGGMSVVFHATDMVLGRPLAIKVLNETYRDEPERVASFENECSLMAKVRHENVVSVYSAGRSRGQFYIAMELVEGRNLELIVAERGYLLPADALEIVRQMALGLQAAHSAGLLHRDVKPGNVIISNEGMARVLDFGLSLEDKPGVDTGEIIWATPYYVPPETLLRQQESVQTDIYALGMTLRNLLTGEATLPGSPQTLDEMLEAKRNLAPLQTLLPRAEKELYGLVAHMTAFDVAERPDGYESLLQEIIATQEAMAAALNPEVRERRYRRKLYAAAALLGSMVLGLLGGYLVALATPSEKVQEVLDADRLSWEECDLYSQAMLALQAGKLPEFARSLALLSEAPADPAVAAAAAFVRTAYSVLDDKTTENGYRRFDELVAQAGGQVSPAGRSRYEALCRLASLIRQDAAAAAGELEQLEDSLVKVAAMILVADHYVQSGQHVLAAGMIQQTMDKLDSCQAEPLRELLDEYRMAAPRRAARVALGQLRQLYQAGALEQADALAAALLKEKLSRLEKEEIRIKMEASAMMQLVREALRSRGGAALPDDASPEQLEQAAAGWQETGVQPAEIACLSHMLRGEYDAAFRRNPYADSDSETEPFAVLMRDWKLRLEK